MVDYSEDVKDYLGCLEECSSCSNNFVHLDCYYNLTGIPGKCENFALSGFNALEMLERID